MSERTEAERILDEETTANNQLLQDKRELEAVVGSAALVKACMDPFDYAMKLRTGEVLRFEHCRIINKDWIHLTGVDRRDQLKDVQIAYSAERGVDVRISDIVWVMDAPEGS